MPPAEKESLARLPNWVFPETDLAALRAMLLVGAWSPEVPADAAALEQFGSHAQAVQSFCEQRSIGAIGDAGALIRYYSQEPRSVDEPGSFYVWEQPKQTWADLAPGLRAIDLDCFAKVATQALSQAPGREIFDEKEPKGPSARLRAGLLNSLALLGNSDGLLEISPPPSQRAAAIVATLLQPQATAWSTLTEQMSFLAEAAPTAFLAAVEDGLTQGDRSPVLNQPQVVRHIAGALSVLCWDSGLLLRASLCLCRLAQRAEAPEGSIRDSHPLQCLQDAFRFGHPQTNASTEDRLKVLQQLYDIYPQVAWELFLLLLRRMDTFIDNVHRPQFLRITVPPADRLFYPGEEYGQLQTIVTLAANFAGIEGERWSALLQNSSQIPESLRLYLLRRCDQVASLLRDNEAQTWDTLRNQLHYLRINIKNVTKHQKSWQNLLDKTNKLYKKLEPKDLALRFAWLFTPGKELPLYFSDLEKEGRYIDVQRNKSIEEIGQNENHWEIIQKLSKTPTISQSLLARFLANVSWAQQFESILLAAKTFESYLDLAPSFLAWRLVRCDFSETVALLRRLNQESRYEEAVRFAISLSGSANDRELQLWTLIDELGDPLRRMYWQTLQYLGGWSKRSSEAVEWAISHFMAVGRMQEALTEAIVAKSSISTALQLDIVEKSLTYFQEQVANQQAADDAYLQDHPEEQINRLFSNTRRPNHNELAKVAEFLENKVNPKFPAEMQRTRELETQLISFLDFFDHYKPRFLPTYLIEHPQEFSALSPKCARNLARLWDGFPGDHLPVPAVDDFLFAWCCQVLTKPWPQAGSDFRWEALATLLARPLDIDGRWPCTAVRRLLEEHPNNSLIRGLGSAKRRLRGATSRAVDAGGGIERALAAGFRRDAEVMKSAWPQTAALLFDMAEYYEGDAKHYDEHAQTSRWRYQMNIPPADVRPLFPLISIRIENFRAIEMLDLPLHPRLTVLYGKNASGKTTVLDAIARGLAAIARRLPRSSDDEDKRLPRFRSTDLRRTLKQKKESADKDWVPEKFVRVSLWGQPRRTGSVIDKDALLWFVEDLQSGDAPQVADREDPALQLYLNAIIEALRTNDPDVAMPVFAYYGTERAVQEEEPGRSERMDLPTPEESSRAAGLHSALAGAARFNRTIRRFWYLVQKEREVRDEKDDRSYELPELRAVRKAVDQVVYAPDGTSCRNLRIKVSTNQVLVDFVRANGTTEPLDIYQLSDGFRTHLALVMDLALRMFQCNPWSKEGPTPDGFGTNSYAIVLIDETDLHLHPSWQQTVLPRLIDAFPNTQFIVTTHSVQVLSSVDDRKYSVWMLDRDPDGKIVKRVPELPVYGARTQDILTDNMDVEERAPKEYREQLAKYLRLIDAGEEQTEEAQRLRKELGQLRPDDADLLRADARVARRRILGKVPPKS